jgi:hypothetical protein
LLLRVQAARRKRDSVQAAREQDAWTTHAAEGLLLAADGHAPVAPPEPEPPPPPPATGDDDKFARCDPAEQYALMYPRRAAEIRACGGIPPTATYGLPDPETVRALIASTSPILQQIDQEYAAPAPA